MEEQQETTQPLQSSDPKKNSLMLPIVILAVVIIGGLLYFAMRNQKTASQQTQPAPTATPTQAPVKTIIVTGSNFTFDPKTITVNKGDHVKIVFKNSGGFHDFIIDEFTVATKRTKDGEEDTVEFIVDKAGTYKYYCSVANHRSMGMEGTLTVQ